MLCYLVCRVRCSGAHIVYISPPHWLPCMVCVRLCTIPLAIPDLKDMVRAITSSDPTHRLAPEAKLESCPFMQVNLWPRLFFRGAWSLQDCRAESRCRMVRPRRCYFPAPQLTSSSRCSSCVHRARAMVWAWCALSGGFVAAPLVGGKLIMGKIDSRGGWGDTLKRSE